MACVLLVLLVGATSSPAGTITFSGSSGDLSASAVFDLSGTTLTITLSNTSLSAVTDPANILTGLFFNSSALTPASATGPAPYGSVMASGTAGSGWVYNSGFSNAGVYNYGLTSGISATGLTYDVINQLGVFGNTGFFNTTHESKISGDDYGIVSASTPDPTSNPLQGKEPLFNNSLVFTFNNVSSSFNPGQTVVFQYGSNAADPHFTASVPEPSLAMLFGLGLGAVSLISRRWKM
jgi:hypothetical protein